MANRLDAAASRRYTTVAFCRKVGRALVKPVSAAAVLISMTGPMTIGTKPGLIPAGLYSNLMAACMKEAWCFKAKDHLQTATD